MLEIRTKVETDALMREIAQYGRNAFPTVGVAMEHLSFLMLENVTEKVSGPYLGVVTSTARRSMEQFDTRVGGGFRAGIGNPFDYVRAHEQGFKGAVDVKAHTRRISQVFGRRLATPATQSVRPHTRAVNMRARHFMRDAVKEEAAGTPRVIARALTALIRLGRIPTVGEF